MHHSCLNRPAGSSVHAMVAALRAETMTVSRTAEAFTNPKLQSCLLNPKPLNFEALTRKPRVCVSFPNPLGPWSSPLTWGPGATLDV